LESTHLNYVESWERKETQSNWECMAQWNVLKQVWWFVWWEIVGKKLWPLFNQSSSREQSKWRTVAVYRMGDLYQPCCSFECLCRIRWYWSLWEIRSYHRSNFREDIDLQLLKMNGWLAIYENNMQVSFENSKIFVRSNTFELQNKISFFITKTVQEPIFLPSSSLRKMASFLYVIHSHSLVVHINSYLN